ncbi:MAG TPA: class I SAM-dependent methyltransferase [Lentisphaeria bacterium]|nr:MAG: methyltransferase type 11 [Lentisphaerae bacterium GWF2_50_93]HCE46709.1 class I SAM-dependent methyltransferase [Lentisphaeria bacterium]
MKVRESDMPEEGLWKLFFTPDAILDQLELTSNIRDAVDFGCGYGTFAIPAAKRIQGTLHGFDVDPGMIESSRQFAEQQDVGNLRLHLRDFMADGTGLPDASVDYAMLFNILHAEDPVGLLSEAFRILHDGGTAGIMHWNYDPETPRGPPMNIRPRAEQCVHWAESAGFIIANRHIELPPYHYGIVAKKGKRP